MSRIFMMLLLLPLLTTFIMKLLFLLPPSDYGTGSMFDLIATRYDFINRVLALNLDIGWRKEMVKCIISSFPDARKEKIWILDLATGTADVPILLKKEYRISVANDDSIPDNELQILGIDPSENMIQIGREKVLSQGMDREVTLNIGDARALTVKDNTFHAVTMSFGIRNIPEKEAVLCEIYRVLKKKHQTNSNDVGKLAILEFSEPTSDFGILGLVARGFIRHVLPLAGAVMSGAPREYLHLQNSIKDFPSPNEFVALMEGVKCGADERGTFQVEILKQMNFGSVQLYVASPILK